ncbi:MAG TPA: hypothetical protein VEX68_02895 [Bryobacteraceae bacterium]|nr:hypothetical protein [Bryobacteraceae bacterium]
MTDTIINVSAGLVGALIGGAATIWTARYTLEKQAEDERERRKQERTDSQLAHDRNVIRLFRAEVTGLRFTDDEGVIFDHLRALRRIMTEYSDLLMEPSEKNQEFYAEYLAHLPKELRLIVGDLIKAKRAVEMLEHPDLPTA